MNGKNLLMNLSHYNVIRGARNSKVHYLCEILDLAISLAGLNQNSFLAHKEDALSTLSLGMLLNSSESS